MARFLGKACAYARFTRYSCEFGIVNVDECACVSAPHLSKGLDLDTFHRIIGSNAQTIAWWQMVVRGTLIFFYTLILVRVGGRRIFGKYTSFDIVLAVILGSIMSRALTANARFIPAMATATALVILHRLLAVASKHSASFARMVKGSAVLLVKNGRVRKRALEKTNMTRRDLMEALRTQGDAELKDVKAAYLERSGQVSVVLK